MKKVLITRKLLESNEERISKLWDAKLNLNDEIYSQNKLIELSKDCDGILCSMVDKIDEETINKLSDSVKIISNFAVGFGNVNIKAARKKDIIVTDMGFSFTSTHQAFKVKEGQTFYTNSGHAPMGWGLPASVGAFYGKKNIKRDQRTDEQI